MKAIHAAISYRLPLPWWESAGNFDRFLAVLNATDMAREFAFFTNDTHTPPPLEEMRRRFAILKQRIAVMHRRGLRAGINQLCTLGHATEDVVHAATGGANFVYASGVVCPGNYCPNDPQWRENYIRECYHLAACCRPDFIWIDDDLRLTNHGNGGGVGCFCPACFARFKDESGYDGELTGLPAYFSPPDPTEQRRRREMLLERNARTTANLCAFIENVVHEVDPDIILGQMDGWQPFGGLDFAGHAEALAGARQQSVWWRPGGGFYTDQRPDEILDKANSIGREAALLPSEVEVIEAELESFNYQQLNKSKFMAALEPQIYCAAGATGVAYNVFPDPRWDDMEDSVPLLDTLNGNRVMLDRLVDANRREAPRGIFDGVGCRIHTAYRGRGGDWLSPHAEVIASYTGDYELQKLGLPVAYDCAHAALYAVSGAAVESMSDAEIRKMLATGAYLDGFALQSLHRRGFGADTGFTVSGILREDAIEEYVDHPLNVDCFGKHRNARQSFWPQPAFVLEAAPGAEILSRCVDYAGQETGACLSGVYTNASGGRIMVAGYYPWSSMFYRNKGAQLKRVFRWLARETLPGWLDSYHRAALWCRAESAVVWNMSQDPLAGGVLAWGVPTAECRAYSADGTIHALRAIAADGGYQRFELPPIPAWSILLIKTKVCPD